MILIEYPRLRKFRYLFHVIAFVGQGVGSRGRSSKLSSYEIYISRYAPRSGNPSLAFVGTRVARLVRATHVARAGDAERQRTPPGTENLTPREVVSHWLRASRPTVAPGGPGLLSSAGRGGRHARRVVGYVRSGSTRLVLSQRPIRGTWTRRLRSAPRLVPIRSRGRRLSVRCHPTLRLLERTL